MLVVQTSFLGDVVLTTPLIAELAKRGHTDVVTTPAGAALLANNPSIRNIFAYDKRGADSGLSGLRRIAARLRRSDRYDAVYMAQGSLRSGMLAFATGARERIGFDTSAGRIFYTTRVPYRPDRHHAERLWWLSMSDCADPPSLSQITPRLYPGEDDRRVVDKLLSDSGLDSPYVALAPGSAWGTKRWPFYPELAVLIGERFKVVIIGGNGDIEIGDSIVAQLPPGRGLNLAGRISLLESAEMIGRSVALVSNDSAPQHLASAIGTPTLTVYGPTVPEFGFGPLAPQSEAIGVTGLACRPCDPHGPARCPLGHWRCMRELSSRDVNEALMRTLSQASSV